MKGYFILHFLAISFFWIITLESDGPWTSNWSSFKFPCFGSTWLLATLTRKKAVDWQTHTVTVSQEQKSRLY
jgi:hypothetical protein